MAIPSTQRKASSAVSINGSKTARRLHEAVNADAACDLLVAKLSVACAPAAIATLLTLRREEKFLCFPLSVIEKTITIPVIFQVADALVFFTPPVIY